MKAIVISEAGGPEVLQYTDIPTPTVKPGWSLIKIKGFGINRSEIFTRNGWSPSVKFPRILGIEGVGEITETTDQQHLPVGQKVITLMGGMGRAFDGSYAEYALIPNQQIYPVTTNLSWSELAAIPETYATAYGSLLALQLRDQDHLFIRGATSGVGVAALKLAKATHPLIKVTGSTRKEAKREQLLAAGFDEVIIEKDGQLQTEQKFDKILELVGPATLLNSTQHVQFGGITCVTGELGGIWELERFDPIGDFPSGTYLTNFSSDTVNTQLVNNLLKIIETAKINVTPTKTFTLAQTPEAQAFLDSDSSFGKVVVLN